MKSFRIYWLGGTTEVVEGKDFEDALKRAGLSKLVSMIDFRVDGSELNYEWNKETKMWVNSIQLAINNNHAFDNETEI